MVINHSVITYSLTPVPSRSSHFHLSITPPLPPDERERSVAEQQDLLHPHAARRSQKNDGTLRRSTKGIAPHGAGAKHTSSGESPIGAVGTGVGVGVGGGMTSSAATGVQAMMDRYGHTLHENQGESIPVPPSVTIPPSPPVTPLYTPYTSFTLNKLPNPL